MDRSDEFLRVAEIFVPEAQAKDVDHILTLGPRKPARLSEFLQTVLITYSVILENEELVKRMTRLSSMKEFSGDPTMNMQELSVQFEMKIKYIQGSLQKLKTMTDKSKVSGQDGHHRQLVTQYLGKIISNHVQSFKLALKEHAKNVDERNKRVQKYGNISSASQSSLLADATQTSKYAMFSQIGLQDSAPLVHIEKNQALRNRRPGHPGAVNSHGAEVANSTSSSAAVDAAQSSATDDGDKGKGGRYQPPRSSLFHQHVTNRNAPPAGGVPYPRYPGQGAPMAAAAPPSSSSAWFGGGAQQQQQQAPKPVTTESRFRHAERVESSIREMGQLFTQMASLIAEQSEVITRIEDDVEIGHQNTVEGYASLQQAYDITKGNRGMILKIFLILIFCIFLFLVWT